VGIDIRSSRVQPAIAMASNNPHDALFKRVFSDVTNAAGEFCSVLPSALVKAMDFKSLELRPGSFVDETLRERHTDLLYSVQLREREAFLYLLFEHQSTVDGLMPYRLLGYICRVWENWLRDHPDARRLPAVIPVVLHHSETGWTAATRLLDLIDLDGESLQAARAYVPDFQFCVDDLSHASDEELYGRAMTAVSRLVLWALRTARGGRFSADALTLWAQAFRELGEAENGREGLEAILRYIAYVRNDEHANIIDAILAEDVGENVQEAYVTLAERLIEEGRKAGLQQGLREGVQQGVQQGLREGVQQGLREGVQQGLREGISDTLTSLLRLRFGALDVAAESRIAKATVDELRRWTERTLVAERIDDVFRR